MRNNSLTTDRLSLHKPATNGHVVLTAGALEAGEEPGGLDPSVSSRGQEDRLLQGLQLVQNQSLLVSQAWSKLSRC